MAPSARRSTWRRSASRSPRACSASTPRRCATTYDMRIFLSPPEQVRRAWKVQRDCSRRGYTTDQVLGELDRREADSESFIRPQSRHADVVVSFRPNADGSDPESMGAELMLRDSLPHPDLSAFMGNGERGLVEFEGRRGGRARDPHPRRPRARAGRGDRGGDLGSAPIRPPPASPAAGRVHDRDRAASLRVARRGAAADPLSTSSTRAPRSPSAATAEARPTPARWRSPGPRRGGGLNGWGPRTEGGECEERSRSALPSTRSGRLSMDAVQRANSGHPGRADGPGAGRLRCSTGKIMDHNPADPDWPDRDRFVLSAGHASMLLYSILHLSGYELPMSELERFRQWESMTPGHPERIPGLHIPGGRDDDRPARTGLRQRRRDGDGRALPARALRPRGESTIGCSRSAPTAT